MSNIISFDENTPVDDELCMSNGLTDVFINVLTLSGSQLAKTVEEKQLIVWLSEKNQQTVGYGTVGFDIVEMPWSKSKFKEEQIFLIKVIKAAEQKMGWEKLDYTPNEKLIIPILKKFREYIERMTENNIREKELYEWISASENDDPINCNFPLCKKHNTLLTLFGCQICNS